MRSWLWFSQKIICAPQTDFSARSQCLVPAVDCSLLLESFSTGGPSHPVQEPKKIWCPSRPCAMKCNKQITTLDLSCWMYGLILASTLFAVSLWCFLSVNWMEDSKICIYKIIGRQGLTSMHGNDLEWRGMVIKVSLNGGFDNVASVLFIKRAFK